MNSLTPERLDALMEPLMARWRGANTPFGRLVLKWDVFMLKRFADPLIALRPEQDPTPAGTELR